jgi:hypothetical protein
MNKTFYLNIKTGKLLEGSWSYNWAADRFSVRIGKSPSFGVSDEYPETDTWKLYEDGKIKYPSHNKVYKYEHPKVKIPVIKKVFWFHYNKTMSKKIGKPQLTIHYGGKCHIVDALTIKVPTYSYNRNSQPYCVIKGSCKQVEIKEGKAIIS